MRFPPGEGKGIPDPRKVRGVAGREFWLAVVVDGTRHVQPEENHIAQNPPDVFLIETELRVITLARQFQFPPAEALIARREHLAQFLQPLHRIKAVRLARAIRPFVVPENVDEGRFDGGKLPPPLLENFIGAGTRPGLDVTVMHHESERHRV